MISARDPATMTPTERRSEVAFLLSTGFLRLLIARKNSLELPAKPEALCAPVDGEKTVARKEPS